MSDLVLPDYEGACLNNLLPSVAARLLGGPRCSTCRERRDTSSC